MIRPEHARAKLTFQRLFTNTFRDAEYLRRERNYKWEALRSWTSDLSRGRYEKLLRAEEFGQIAAILMRINRNLNLLGTFETMALSDALKSDEGARLISTALFERVYGNAPQEARFTQLANALAKVPLARGKIITWPVQTLFPFLAKPDEELFLKPVATRTAADRFGFELGYKPSLNWATYRHLLEFGRALMADLSDWKPVDLIDIQGFIWVTTSSGYAEELI